MEAHKTKRTKSVGALTALQFAYECGRRGAIISEPIGDDSRYDFIIDNGEGNLFRVQVKTATPEKGTKGVFSFNAMRKPMTKDGKLLIPYTKNEVDCLVTYAGGEWFFYPDVEILPSCPRICPAQDASAYKWNFGKGNCSALDLPAEPIDLNVTNAL